MTQYPIGYRLQKYNRQEIRFIYIIIMVVDKAKDADVKN